VFSSPEVRLLATKVDGTILAIKWGSTRPEAAINALHLLRQIPSLRGEPAAKIYAVLAHAEWRARTQFSQG
jgi:hypothetical protein